MKLPHLLPAIVAAFGLAAPLSASARDKHDRDHHDRNDHRDHHDRGDYRHNYYRNYGYNRYRGYGYGGYGYGGYGYGYGYPYYYSRPSIGFSYYSSPTTVYRGRTAGSYYADSLSVDVQRELRRRGYYRGSIDGDIGPGSRAAIRNYQADRGLAPTGRIDSTLLRSLGIG
jgi:hypothetical protein